MATVTAGSAMVAGTGKDRYFVSDASGKSLTNADTNTPIELFPGNYIVELHSSTQPITVREGQRATVTAVPSGSEGLPEWIRGPHLVDQRERRR